MSTPLVVSKLQPLQQYNWGDNCEAWNLVDNNDLSIKLESISAKAEEVLHYHKYSQQFFFITKGRAIFEVDNVILIVYEKQGLLIKAGKQHRIMNKEETSLEFMVCSQPAVGQDRYNLV